MSFTDSNFFLIWLTYISSGINFVWMQKKELLWQSENSFELDCLQTVLILKPSFNPRCPGYVANWKRMPEIHCGFYAKYFSMKYHEPSAWKCIWCRGLSRLLFLINEPLYACQISHTTANNNNKKMRMFSEKGILQRLRLPGLRGLFRIHDGIFWFWLIHRMYGHLFFPRWIPCLPTRFCRSRPIKEKISQRLAIIARRAVVFMFQNGLFINSYWSGSYVRHLNTPLQPSCSLK